MRAAAQLLLGIFGIVVITPWAADAATISGTVAGPDGAAFRGAFVQARNAKSKIVVSVLSDRDAYRYLPASTAYLPPRLELLERLGAAGFERIEHRSFLLGSAQLITATRS